MDVIRVSICGFLAICAGCVTVSPSSIIRNFDQRDCQGNQDCELWLTYVKERVLSFLPTMPDGATYWLYRARGEVDEAEAYFFSDTNPSVYVVCGKYRCESNSISISSRELLDVARSELDAPENILSLLNHPRPTFLKFCVGQDSQVKCEARFFEEGNAAINELLGALHDDLSEG